MRGGGGRGPIPKEGGQGGSTEEEAFVFWANFCCQVAVSEGKCPGPYVCGVCVCVCIVGMEERRGDEEW